MRHGFDSLCFQPFSLFLLSLVRLSIIHAHPQSPQTYPREGQTLMIFAKNVISPGLFSKSTSQLLKPRLVPWRQHKGCRKSIHSPKGCRCQLLNHKCIFPPVFRKFTQSPSLQVRHIQLNPRLPRTQNSAHSLGPPNLSSALCANLS
jgi:hypothetical protein